jgi:hypothetical protein
MCQRCAIWPMCLALLRCYGFLVSRQGRGSTPFLRPLEKVVGVRRFVLLLASMHLAVLLAMSVASANGELAAYCGGSRSASVQQLPLAQTFTPKKAVC